MMLNRRGFLGTLAAAMAGSVLDPERLLWVPGAKTIFLPTVERFSGNTFITPQWVTHDVAMFWRNSLRTADIVDRPFRARNSWHFSS